MGGKRNKPPLKNNFSLLEKLLIVAIVVKIAIWILKSLDFTISPHQNV